MRWLKRISLFMLLLIGIVGSHRLSVFASDTPWDVSSDVKNNWNDLSASVDASNPSGRNLVYDVYRNKFTSGGYKIVSKDFGNGTKQFVNFQGWAINFEYYKHTSTNQDTYIVAQEVGNSSNVKIYKALHYGNLSATEDVEYNNQGSGVWNECSATAKNQNNEDDCNMRYDDVGFSAYIPVNELFPNRGDDVTYKLYIVKKVVANNETKIVYAPLILPFHFDNKDYSDGEISLESRVDSNKLVMRTSSVLRRTYPRQLPSSIDWTPRYFTEGKTYYTTDSEESKTAVWYAVTDTAGSNNDDKWAATTYWSFGGSPAVLEYTPIYTWKDVDCGIPKPAVTPTYEVQPDFPDKTTAHWQKLNKSGTVVDEGDYNCPVTVTVVDDRKNVDGYMKYKATAKHPKDSSHDSYAYGESLWVSKVDVYFNNKDGDKWDAGDTSYPQDTSSYTYEDEKPSTPSCLKWYGPSYVKETNCYNQLVGVDYKNTTQYNQQCYKYEDAYTNKDDASCTRSYKVSKVDFTLFIDNVYTGIPVNFQCGAYFYNTDGSGSAYRYDITSYDNVWSSDKISGVAYTPGENMIGNNRYVYKDRRGLQYKNGMTSPHIINLNSFYTPDPNDGTYQITCGYIPENYKDYKFAITGNDSQSNGVSISKNTTLHGIDKLRVSVQGCFFDVNNPGNYKCYTTDQYPDGTKTALGGTYDTYTQFDFIKAHWYNWKAEIMYTDGTDGTGSRGYRDVTTAPEIYWQANPWYSSTAQNWFTHMAQNSTCSGCTDLNGSDGGDHRVPQNEWNLVTAHFFDEETKTPKKTYQTVMYWAHDIEKFKIRGARSLTSYTSLPIDGMDATDPFNAQNEDPYYDALTDNSTIVKPLDTINYTAWVIWTDDPTGKYGAKNPFNRGQKENWSNAVTWYGDDLISQQPITGNKATYTFKRIDNLDYHTIDISYIDFTDGPNSWGKDARNLGLSNWLHLTDKLTVKVSNSGCTGLIEHNCPIKTLPAPPSNECLASDVGWQTSNFGTDPSSSRTNLSGTNYLPPSAAYGLSNCWDAKNNPYRFSIDFSVTGISDGIGSK